MDRSISSIHLAATFIAGNHFMVFWFRHILIALLVCAVAVVPGLAQEPDSEPLWHTAFAGKSIDCSATNWMHTAKTSSTFCMTLQHVCCPDQFQNLTSGVTIKMLEKDMATPKSRAASPFSFDSQYCYTFKRKGYDPLVCNFAGRPEHIPLSPKINLQEKMGIMVVREPKSRLISAFLDGVHIENFANRSEGYQLRTLFHEMDMNKSMNHHERLLTQAQLYADHHSQVGHQVKMLVGGITLDLSVKNETVMKSLVERAVKRMREFYFVGIFDQYARSLRLFHAMANKGTTPTDVELFPRRSTSPTDKAYLMQNLRFEDPYDTLLYQAAQKIFQEELDYVKKWKNITL